ncbi:MAG: phosphate ABC transporter permease PstA [Alphaproteobacteria bacterium]|nr:phosphate ABC transporter permease PstA [Alphaproteobacteria bacterium]
MASTEVKTGIHTSPEAARRLARRYRQEAFFQFMGLIAIVLALSALAWLMASIFGTGLSAFRQHEVQITASLDPELIDPERTGDPEVMRRGDYRTILQRAIYDRFPEAADDRKLRLQLMEVYSVAGGTGFLRDFVLDNPGRVGDTVTLWIPASDDVDQMLKGKFDLDVPQELRKVTDVQIAWVRELQASGELRASFNKILFLNTDSRDPELAGVAAAVVGSFYALLVTFVLSFPMGVAAAIYLEEFAPKNRFTDFIEVNINNLAAVPSIVFGLLGLAVFLNFFGLPRSAPLVGGMVLALMTLPTIIIATRASLKAVPPSIREGALGVGASKLQSIYHHVLPLAMPGILTGTIIGMAQALGETAPLLMIGMVAFVTQIPESITTPASALPVQVFLWSDSPERAWEERTSAAIIILLGFLTLMNLVAVLLRSRFERRW